MHSYVTHNLHCINVCNISSEALLKIVFGQHAFLIGSFYQDMRNYSVLKHVNTLSRLAIALTKLTHQNHLLVFLRTL